MIDQQQLKAEIGQWVERMGLASANDTWVKIINEVSIHFAVWHGWSLDRITALPAEEILNLLRRENEKGSDFRVGKSFRHSEDFSFITWKGQKYHLNRSQARVFELLYNEAMKGTNGLHQSTLGKMLNSSNSQFRLLHVFRLANGDMHPIWGKLIVTLEPGVYGIELDE